MKEEYSKRERGERDLTYGNPDCGCMQNRDSLSPMEKEVAAVVSYQLRIASQNEKRNYQVN